MTDPGVGFAIVDLSGKKRDSSVAVNGQMATCWSARSVTTGNYYTIDVGGNMIREVHIDGNLKGGVVAVRAISSKTSRRDFADV